MGTERIRQAVLAVALLNLAYFFVEFFAALSIGSASLFADSADFLEDTAINLLVYVAVAWPAPRRRAAGSVLSALILVPAIAAIVTVATKIVNPVAPSPEGLTAVAAGALVVNVVCALILMRLRDKGILAGHRRVARRAERRAGEPPYHRRRAAHLGVADGVVRHRRRRGDRRSQPFRRERCVGGRPRGARLRRGGVRGNGRRLDPHPGRSAAPRAQEVGV